MKTKVVIVSRTRVGENGLCIGALSSSFNHFRLTPDWPGRDSRFWSRRTCDMRVGDCLDVTLAKPPSVISPHVEDMIVKDHSKYNSLTYPQLRSYLRNNSQHIRDRWWSGPPKSMFDGKLETTHSGSFYLPDGTTYSKSTGYWQPGKELSFDDGYYFYEGTTLHMKYVGDAKPFPTIFARAVVRVSLSTSWQNNDGDSGCWLQLSGVF